MTIQEAIDDLQHHCALTNQGPGSFVDKRIAVLLDAFQREQTPWHKLAASGLWVGMYRDPDDAEWRGQWGIYGRTASGDVLLRLCPSLQDLEVIVTRWAEDRGPLLFPGTPTPES